MVSEKPPRRSKSGAEPITIDLDAKDVTALPAQEPPQAEPEAAAKGTPDAPDAAPSPADAPAPAEQPVASRQEPSETVKPDSDKPDSDGPDSGRPGGGSQEEARQPMPASPPPAASQGETAGKSPTAGLIAAGIVGGLVALTAAGSMQYAGYLPPFANGRGDPTAIDARLEKLRDQIAALPRADSSSTVDLSAIESRLAALEANPAPAALPEIGAFSDRLAALSGALAALQSEISAQAGTAATVARRLDAVEAKLNAPRDDVEVARAIAAAALKTAIDRGGPFLAELDTLAKVAGDDPAVAGLRPFAAAGVLSRAELTRDFPGTADAMLAALRQPDPTQGIFGRLIESAGALVKVRPVGNVEGDSPEAIVARMENKLRNGDLRGAALEWQSLPEPAKAASAPYKKSLDARIEVEELAGGTLSRAIGATQRQG